MCPDTLRRSPSLSLSPLLELGVHPIFCRSRRLFRPPKRPSHRLSSWGPIPLLLDNLHGRHSHLVNKLLLLCRPVQLVAYDENQNRVLQSRVKGSTHRRVLQGPAPSMSIYRVIHSQGPAVQLRHLDLATGTVLETGNSAGTLRIWGLIVHLPADTLARPGSATPRTRLSLPAPSLETGNLLGTQYSGSDSTGRPNVCPV